MGIVLSIFVIAAGGELAWSGTGSESGTGPGSAGLVLIAAGLIWLVLSLLISDAYSDQEPGRPRVIHLRGARPGTPERHR